MSVHTVSMITAIIAGALFLLAAFGIDSLASVQTVPLGLMFFVASTSCCHHHVVR
jgi:hypothetical protein